MKDVVMMEQDNAMRRTLASLSVFVVASLVLLGAGCGMGDREPLESTSSTAAATSSVVLPEAVSAPTADDFAALWQEYQVAILVSDGLDKKYAELEDWIQMKNYDDPLLSIPDALQSISSNEPTPFHGLDENFLSVFSDTPEIRRLTLASFEQKIVALKSYQQAVQRLQAGDTKQAQVSLVQARKEVQSSSRFFIPAKKLMGKVLEQAEQRYQLHF